MSEAVRDQWILTPEEYADLPAFKGTTIEEELENRRLAVDHIRQLGTRLKLPQPCIASGILLMHRFYIREKFGHKFPRELVAPAAIFVASKVDEHPRKIKDVLQANFCVRFKTDSPDSSFSFHDENPEYIKLKEQLLSYEKILLQACCFDLTFKHPYNYVFRNVKLLQDKDVEDQLVQAAWTIINESLSTTICIRFPPKAVSAAAVYLAAQREGINICEIVGNSSAEDPIDVEIFPDAPKDMVREIISILKCSAK